MLKYSAIPRLTFSIKKKSDIVKGENIKLLINNNVVKFDRGICFSLLRLKYHFVFWLIIKEGKIKKPLVTLINPKKN